MCKSRSAYLLGAVVCVALPAWAQRTPRTRACALAATLWATLWASAQTLPRGYEIVDITRDNGRYESTPRINNRGQVVYTSWNVPLRTDSEIWFYDSASNALTPITDDDVYDVSGDIADDGTIVWMRYIGPDMGEGPTPEIMMRTPDGVVTRITDNAAWDSNPHVNSRRQLLWKRYGPEVCGGHISMDLFLYDGSQVTRLTSSGETYGYANQGAEINDWGDIVWTEYDFCDPPPPYNFTSRVMLYSNGQTQALSSTLTPQAADLNNRTVVVWDDYNVSTRKYMIYMWEPGGHVVLLTDSGINAAVNDSNQIAFTRDAGDPALDVFLWQNGEFTQITRDSLRKLVPDLNNDGEIVWTSGPGFPVMDVRMLRRHGLGDLNCDGALDAFDIEGFVLALFDRSAYDAGYPACDPMLADINADASVDAFDVEPFMQLLFP